MNSVCFLSPETVSPLDPIELCSVLTDSMRNRELDVQDENGQTPLHLASMRGATICCVHLLQVVNCLAHA